MTTMNISLPDALKAYVDAQVREGDYGTSSEYLRELIRRDQDRNRMRALMLEGLRSAPAGPADVAYFDALRRHVAGRRHKAASVPRA
ncbi:MAG: type II toxin-antitoxin system ParD family antitoxin [Burkholderiaceae bacterium]|nr:type II toxin-antitoxin system ParD family antitoxin [Burkholderiaceae bacterium]